MRLSSYNSTSTPAVILEDVPGNGGGVSPYSNGKNEGLSMKGVIRTREKCAYCGGKFEEGWIGRERDLVCSCGRTPRTYYVYLYWNGDHKIVNDKQGNQLKSYFQANRLLERIRSEIDSKTFDITEYKQKTRKQFSPHKLILKWYRLKHKKGLAPTTLKDYRGYIRNYFSPSCQKQKIEDCREIRTINITEFFTSLPNRLSLKTKKNIMVALKNFTDWLQDQEILERNPTYEKFDVPEPKKKWSKKSVALQALQFVPEHDRPIIHFMLYHPVRSGEACALKVKDFNADEGYIHIQRAISLGEERHRKNRKSYLCAISEQFDVQKIIKLKFPEQFVFVNSLGNHYTSNHLKKIWKKACEKAGIEYIPLKYSSRTTIATEAINRGVPIEHVAGALGNSVAVANKHYAHLQWKATKGVVDGK